jgi:hypothetical protein
MQGEIKVGIVAAPAPEVAKTTGNSFKVGVFSVALAHMLLLTPSPS